MVNLVGSRHWRTNTPESDYDYQICKKSEENTHYILKRRKIDYHYFLFENKAKLLARIGQSSVQALLYPKFRRYWRITIAEAKEKLNLYHTKLRNYEMYLADNLGQKIDKKTLKYLYEQYRAEHKDKYKFGL